jgi:hypothetical protein
MKYLLGTALVFTVAWLALGCAPKPVAVVQQTAPTATGANQAAGTAESSSLPVGNKMTEDGHYICPVKGIPIRDTSQAQTYVYDGFLFYLDCVGSKNKFRKNPEGYLSGEIRPKDCGGKRECVDDQPAESVAQAAKR